MTADADPLDAAVDGRRGRGAGAGHARRRPGAIVAQAQGIPLFAVETIRSFDRPGLVVPPRGCLPAGGRCRELTVPDSLHALLAARLDALDPDCGAWSPTRPCSDVVPAEAWSRSPAGTRPDGAGALDRAAAPRGAEVSADPLSPERGSYRFAQNLLGQVAYETLSRRDRKARHLAVAAHLRATFAGDGDEVIRRRRPALPGRPSAVPDDTDAGDIRAHAVAALFYRAGQRALRSGSAGAAATAYAKAADLTSVPDDEAALEGAADLYERASRAAQTGADYTTSVAYADQAAALYQGLGRVRDEARAKASAGVALLLAGRFTEAGVRLTPALEVLTPEPDADTVRALGSLAALEALAGGPDADRLSAEALELGQALEVSRSDLAELFSVRGLDTAPLDRCTNRPSRRTTMLLAVRVRRRLRDPVTRLPEHLDAPAAQRPEGPCWRLLGGRSPCTPPSLGARATSRSPRRTRPPPSSAPGTGTRPSGCWKTPRSSSRRQEMTPSAPRRWARRCA